VNIEKGAQGKPGDLTTWLAAETNKPPSKELLKGMPDSAVKPVSNAAEQ
jgi:hypothetical protein